ncbi:MAG: glycosyltransferase family 2 protein [Gemmatimonadales bacterium]|nr:glycosyltransferase family 2 protein [Gemmatimonadales bacterium]MXX78071.1 glycosyltransferase family 2 protein [Gemmatimonadales bacterium]MYC87015.1 glycosyltransferase family 2 protein [Candidatus Palauibacter denitrificans]
MGQTRISVVMPVYNEEATLEAIVRRVKEVAPDVELVAVDDGSADASASILSRLEAEGLVDRIFVHERNRGKGAALSTGFRGASGDIIIVQDADLEYDPAEYPRLLEPILAGRADVVYGSRFMGGQPHRVLYYWHYVGNRWLTWLSNMVTNLNLTDMETCYKCFRREVIEQLTIEERAFGVEPEITAKVAMGGWRVYEVGISYAGRTYAEGKKIGWRDGVSALRCIFLYGFVRRWTRKGAPRAAREATGGIRSGVESGES